MSVCNIWTSKILQAFKYSSIPVCHHSSISVPYCEHTTYGYRHRSTLIHSMLLLLRLWTKETSLRCFLSSFGFSPSAASSSSFTWQIGVSHIAQCISDRFRNWDLNGQRNSKTNAVFQIMNLHLDLFDFSTKKNSA